jgi:hypothetical protein
MTTPNIDLLLSDITFRNGIRAESVVVTVHNGDHTQFAVVALRDLIDEVRALREQRDAERAVIEAAKALRDSVTNRQWVVANDRLEDAVDALRELEEDA